MAGKVPFKTELSRELNLFHITMMGLGMMIGAGVFIGIGNSINCVGPGGVILTFAFNMALAICTAMSYAELSSAIPKAGGAYNFARIGFGRGTSFLAGWMEWFAASVAGSIYAVTFSIYIIRFFNYYGFLFWIPEYFMGISFIGILEKILAIIIALAFLFINYRGASETGRIGAIMTLGQTIFLIFIGVVGFVVVFQDPSRFKNFEPFMPNGWGKLFVTMGFTFVAFEGYEVIAQAGDETIEPKKNLPKAMLLSVFIVGLTYMAVSFASVVAVPGDHPDVTGPVWKWIGSFKEKGFGEAVSHLIPYGNLFVTLAVIFASTSALNATIFSAARASYALGRDRMLPQFFSNISRKRKTPWTALIFSGIIVILVSLLQTTDVASSASIMFLFLFFMVNICVIKIRRSMGNELIYGYIMPLFPVFPIIALVFQIILAVWLVEMSIIAWIIAPSWIIIGIFIYQFYSKKHALPIEDELLVIEEEQAPPGNEYRVMVPVANPENALSLVLNTIKLCSHRKARIKLLHMVKVFDVVSLRDAGDHLLEGREGIVEAMIYLRPRFPITSTIRYCRNIARGIISTVREKKVNLIIMGWHGEKKDNHFKFGSTLDPVINQSPCDIIILKNCGNRKFNHLMVPVLKNDNDAYALETAKKIIEKKDSTILIHSPCNPKEQESREKYIESLIKRFKDTSVPINVKVEATLDISNSILKEAEKSDAVVLGFSPQHLLHSVGIHNIFEEVAYKCKKPLILVKAARGIADWTKKWI